MLPVRSILNRCDSNRVPFEWTINPYRGCEFGCKYCYARYTHEYMELDAAEFEKILDKIQNREMPPENKPQPSAAQRKLITSWIEAAVLGCDCDHPDPGRVTIRRLNRSEYNRTIRDLVGVDFQPADDFPADDVGYGFDNIGDVLSLSPMLMRPSMRTLSIRSFIRLKQRNSVDLPQPEGPINAVTSFSLIFSEISFNARDGP